MNERIQELAKEHFCRIEFDNGNTHECYEFSESELEKFAELIVQECAENFTKVWYEQGLDIRGAELGKFMKRFNEHFGVEK